MNGITPGETITLRLRGSTVTVAKPGAPPQKPLASSWAMPTQAAFSIDGETWLHTEKGTRQDEWMIYTLKPEAASVFVAWGPPYTPSTAPKFVRAMSEKSPHAKATELCRSRGDRAVPMLHIQEGERTPEQRFGVWVQARQHAWESGSSWVAQGFAEWLLSDATDAAWLRQHAEIFIVPIMDVDNTATGNGGKDAQPQDHNRDWSAQPPGSPLFSVTHIFCLPNSRKPPRPGATAANGPFDVSCYRSRQSVRLFQQNPPNGSVPDDPRAEIVSTPAVQRTHAPKSRPRERSKGLTRQSPSPAIRPSDPRAEIGFKVRSQST